MPETRTTRTTAKQTRFLTHLAEYGSISAAAQASGLPRQTLYDWRARDAGFAAAWDRAREIGLDALEDEAIRRAIIGEERPQFFNDGRCIVPRKYSDLLLMFLLKHRRPNRYGEIIPCDANHPGSPPDPVNLTSVAQMNYVPRIS